MSCLVSHLSYRPPYRFPELLAFFRDRALAHVELVDDVSYTRTVRLEDRDGNVACGWVRVEDDPAGSQLVVTMSDELVPAVSEVIARVRRMFDTDSDPVAISQALSPLDEAVRGVHIDGVRVPGCFDTFEIACRAVSFPRSEQHTSELQSPAMISHAVFCLTKKKYPLEHQPIHA